MPVSTPSGKAANLPAAAQIVRSRVESLARTSRVKAVMISTPRRGRCHQLRFDALVIAEHWRAFALAHRLFGISQSLQKTSTTWLCPKNRDYQCTVKTDSVLLRSYSLPRFTI